MGIGPLKRAVFLDRDGVLNRAIVRGGKPYPPDTIGQMETIPGAADCLAELKRMGFLLIVVTNQPDVARGTQSRETVEAMHGLLRSQLPVDEFMVCYHDDRDACSCRKPRPGLLMQAAAARGIDLSRSFLIGDRWRDIDAGSAAGCKTIWIDYQYKERGPSAKPDVRVNDLCEAVEWIAIEVGADATRSK